MRGRGDAGRPEATLAVCTRRLLHTILSGISAFRGPREHPPVVEPGKSLRLDHRDKTALRSGRRAARADRAWEVLGRLAVMLVSPCVLFRARVHERVCLRENASALRVQVELRALVIGEIAFFCLTGCDDLLGLVAAPLRTPVAARAVHASHWERLGHPGSEPRPKATVVARLDVDGAAADWVAVLVVEAAGAAAFTKGRESGARRHPSRQSSKLSECRLPAILSAVKPATAARV